ncbi:hypothetical protein [Thermodesulfatator atlanticus]|uniref:hypothetical protein n=1 Tax=Thermodesulfatator atlanticus TaxID=501497 RepID=UPI0003B3C40F|nr:hypothetical protein [Thermodesulfatator atlanticus]
MQTQEAIKEIEKRLGYNEEKVDRSMRELEILRQISTDNLMATLELRKAHEQLSREFKEFKDEMKDFKDEMKAFKDEMKVFKDEMLAFKNEMKDFKDEMHKFKDESNKRWAELAQRLGTLAEDIFGPGIPYLIKQFGHQIKERFFDYETGPKGRKRQFDVIVITTDKNGQETIWIAEVKSQARADDFSQLKDALDFFVNHASLARGQRIIPILAALRVPEDLKNLANKAGVLLVKMGGDYLEPLNPEIISAEKC